jgi:glycogen operon protein
MLLAGDEFARTQHGNNNAYCQDSEIGWVDWTLDEDGAALLQFVRQAIKLRLAYPILRRGRYLIGAYNEELGVKDVAWLAPSGEEMSIEQWHDGQGRCLGMLLDGRAQPTGIRRSGSDSTLLLIVNAHYESVDFRLPQVPQGNGWRRLLDTARVDADREVFAFGREYQVGDRALLLFELNRPPDAQPGADL